ncbi:hypothetical protein V1512DRAFT_259220 [Lipomyces arxii]|uniref:uncharacterized protein n=1 Tax=Lipomyces arxii TaxID=56418 RepID=UPI0034CEF429
MSAADLRSPTRYAQGQPRKARELYSVPAQLPNLSPQQLLYNSSPELNRSPDLSLSGSESDHIFNDEIDSFMMERAWSQEPSSQYRTRMIPPSSPPQRSTEMYSQTAFMGQDPSVSLYTPQDTVGNRYDIFSRLPLQPYLNSDSSLLEPLQVSSDVAMVEYTDYDDDFYVNDGYDYHSTRLAALPSHPIFPYANGPLAVGTYARHDHTFIPTESDYEADYHSEALSPSFSSAEDNTDFSSPELAQTKTFSSPNRKVSWSSAWQPIVTADPITKAKVTISAEDSDSRKGRLPTKALDAFVGGRDANGKYVCKFENCGKTFGRRYNIRTHIQTHLSDRPHVCATCDARFVRQHDLRRHEKKHEGKKPYVCRCGKAFARQDAMMRHRARLICTAEEEDNTSVQD